MEEKKFKIGDVVRINSKPSHWASEYNENCPTQLSNENFPFIGTITKLKYSENYYPCEIGNYGFDLYTLEQTNNIQLVSNANDNKSLKYLIKKLDKCFQKNGVLK